MLARCLGATRVAQLASRRLPENEKQRNVVLMRSTLSFRDNDQHIQRAVNGLVNTLRSNASKSLAKSRCRCVIGMR